MASGASCAGDRLDRGPDPCRALDGNDDRTGQQQVGRADLLRGQAGQITPVAAPTPAPPPMKTSLVGVQN